MPFEIMTDSISCEIDDGSGLSCDSFLVAATITDCTADIRFNYTFTNIGLGCVDVMAVRSQLGSLGTTLLRFNDVYSYRERELCNNEMWTVPDRRSSVNLCNAMLDESWCILLEVDELYGRRANATHEYEWPE